MWTKQKRKSIKGRLIVPVLATAFLSYFGFHAYNGAYGIYSKEQLQAQTVVLNKQLADLTEQRELSVRFRSCGTAQLIKIFWMSRRAAH